MEDTHHSAGSDAVRDVLTRFRRIAVVGLSDQAHRASHRVAEYMLRRGYHISPVNPEIEEVFGLRSYSSLMSVPDPIEIVNVFRRSEFLPAIVREAVQKRAKVLWTQLGVEHDEAAEEARRRGLIVITNRCIMVEHRTLFS